MKRSLSNSRVSLIRGLLVMLFFFLVPSADASGILTLKGRLKSFTDNQLTIETAANRYVVSKTELSQDAIAYFKNKRSGEAVEFTVSTEAIKSVDALSNSNK